MPPRKSTKVEKDKKVAVDTKLEIKEEKKTRVSKAKQNNDVQVVEPVKEVKKAKTDKVTDKQWAEVTDDGDYHNNEEQQENSEESSEESSESDKELLIEAIKTVADKINKTKNTKSVTDFDYEELFELDQEELVDYDTNTLLKVLMVRGTKTNNPILWGKCKTLLQILNFELKPNQPRQSNQSRHYNNNNKYNAKKPEQPYNDNKKVDEKPDTNEQNTESKKVFSNWRKGNGGKKE
jgi:hypothetical protein